MDEKPLSDDVAKETLAFFQRHVVPLHITLEREGALIPKIYTACILEIAGHWLLITSGHCIEEVDYAVRNHGYKIKESCLIDCMSLGSKHSRPVPFDFYGASPWSTSKEMGRDFGVMYLDENYVELLKENNVVALNEKAWAEPPCDPDFCLLIGVPWELSKSDGENAVVTTTFHPIRPVNSEKYMIDYRSDAFEGVLDIDERLTDIEGLSGGPVLAFKEEDGHLKYWLIAIQRGWLKSSSTIRAEFILPLGSFLYEAGRKHRKLERSPSR